MLDPRYHTGPKSPRLGEPKAQPQADAPAAAPMPNPKLPPSANALKSGLSSSRPVHVVLPGEECDFETFRREMLAALAPVGPTEESLASEIIHGHWRLERAHRMEAALYDEIERSAGGIRAAQAQAEAFLDATKGLQRMALYIARIERALRRASVALESRQAARKAETARLEQEAVLITELAAAEGNSFDPAEHFAPEYCGPYFVYSREGIERRIARAKCLERAESRLAAA
jgi:hypothetical protein